MELGALGEFFGAIAVAVTLGYLVVQIRQNTKTLKSSIYTDWVNLSSTVHIMMANNAELFARVEMDLASGHYVASLPQFVLTASLPT